jgi:transcriptional/translational regulatory protein YebC/TACO1
MIPKTTVPVNDAATAERVLKLVDALDENDDVQNVYANFDIPDELLNSME